MMNEVLKEEILKEVANLFEGHTKVAQDTIIGLQKALSIVSIIIIKPLIEKGILSKEEVLSALSSGISSEGVSDVEAESRSNALARIVKVVNRAFDPD
ncbi:hypothetical protein [Pararhodospirillum photometricum]|uniref:hypothetical protein n=1 Tax=Pararhodospirillum photometricum TaxID=1084 RepID=UPI00030B8198|nr:hypothetical protein [Pararhodospirillum photometricum]